MQTTACSSRKAQMIHNRGAHAAVPNIAVRFWCAAKYSVSGFKGLWPVKLAVKGLCGNEESWSEPEQKDGDFNIDCT